MKHSGIQHWPPNIETCRNEVAGMSDNAPQHPPTNILCFMNYHITKLSIVCMVFCLGTPLLRAAELQPGELAVVAASNNRDSKALAMYYMRVRGIPAEHLCLVDLPPEEVCSRAVWEEKIRPAIRRWLAEHDPDRKLKCLVTVWGVPLKIGPAAPTANSLRYQSFLAAELDHRLKLLTELVSAFDRLAPTSTPTTEPPASSSAQKDTTSASTPKDSKPIQGATPTTDPLPPKSESEITTLQKKLETSLQGAQQRVAALSDGEERQRLQVQLQQLATAAGGPNVLLPALSQRLTTDDPNKEQIKAEFDALRGRLTAQLEDRALLEQMPPGIERDAYLIAMIERSGGLLNSHQWIDQQLQTAKKNETGASFDSELSLVLWDDNYQLLRWQSNYLRPGFSNSQLPTFFPTLMVARIDAPTLRLAKGLIDTAIEVEKKGLRGKVYLDGRGIAKLDRTPQSAGSYEDYDRSLLMTARGIETQTDLKVVLETTPKLFQAKECPDAALYCGWYSLAKYIDAFDWVPGAVAYHLASSEATTLHDPASEVWCKKMLEDGVCATIGPVYEPYLAAFPRPDEFFALLLRGDRTLVECYYLTQPFNSWMMTLIGDPLYRPFKYRMVPSQGGVTPAPPAPSKPAVPALPSSSGGEPTAKQ